MTDEAGHPFEIHTVPLPSPLLLTKASARLPATRIYVGNSVVLAPSSTTRMDNASINVLDRAFPTRRMVPIDTTDPVRGFCRIPLHHAAANSSFQLLETNTAITHYLIHILGQ